MRKLLLAGLTVSALTFAAYTPAQAQGGCGPYGHRGWDGYCRPGGYGPVHYWGGPYGWHRPWGPGWGWHHRWGWHRGW